MFLVWTGCGRGVDGCGTPWRDSEFVDDGGVDALKSKNKGGNNRHLSFKDEEKAIADFAEKAKEGKFVRVSEMQEEFSKRTGVSYSTNAFYDLLHRHGWRKVKPRGRHPKKASDEAIETSKKLTLLSWS